MFIVSLAIADLIVGLIVMPISAIYIFTVEWVFGLVVCQFWIAVDYLASTASILNLFILSLDRYWSVTSPLKYLRKRTKKRAMLMISVVWFVSSLWLIPIIGWHYFEHGGTRTVPSNVCDTEYATNTVLKIITGILNYYLPLGVMFALYTKIFMEIRKRSKLELGQHTAGGAFISTGSRKGNHPKKEPVPWSSSLTEDTNNSNDHNDEVDDIHSNTTFSESNEQSRRFIERTASRPGTEYETETGSEDEFSRLHRSGYTNLTLTKSVSTDQGGTTTCSSDVPTSDIEMRVEYFYDETVLESKTERVHRFYDEHCLPVFRVPASPSPGSQPRTLETCLTSPSSPVPELKLQRNHNSLVLHANGTRRPNFDINRITSKFRPQPRKRRRRNSTVPGLINFRRLRNNKYDMENSLKKQALRFKDRIGSRSKITRKQREVKKQQHSAALSREIKAAKQLGVIMGAFTICFCPYFVLFMVVAFCDGCISAGLMLAVTWVGYLNSTLNPFLYPLCNSNFRRKFRSMLRLGDDDSRLGPVSGTYVAGPSRITRARPSSVTETRVRLGTMT